MKTPWKQLKFIIKCLENISIKLKINIDHLKKIQEEFIRNNKSISKIQ